MVSPLCESPLPINACKRGVIKQDFHKHLFYYIDPGFFNYKIPITLRVFFHFIVFHSFSYEFKKVLLHFLSWNFLHMTELMITTVSSITKAVSERDTLLRRTVQSRHLKKTFYFFAANISESNLCRRYLWISAARGFERPGVLLSSSAAVL